VIDSGRESDDADSAIAASLTTKQHSSFTSVRELALR
jgi:hypothetical protein